MDNNESRSDERSAQVSELFAALAKAQSEIESASKDKTNPHFKSRYADLASIREACQAALARNGLAVLQFPASDGKRVSMKTLIGHASGQWWLSPELAVEARDASPQAVGSAITYLRRYQASAVVFLSADDDDAETAQGRGADVPPWPARESYSERPMAAPAKAASPPPPATGKIASLGAKGGGTLVELDSGFRAATRDEAVIEVLRGMRDSDATVELVTRRSRDPSKFAPVIEEVVQLA